MNYQPEQFIVMQECSAGNAEVGDSWIEARTFLPTATLAEVWAWSQKYNRSGRTMLRPDMAKDMAAVKP